MNPFEERALILKPNYVSRVGQAPPDVYKFCENRLNHSPSQLAAQDVRQSLTYGTEIYNKSPRSVGGRAFHFMSVREIMMTITQMSPLSINLGGSAMVLGATAGIILISVYANQVNLARAVYGYIAVWAFLVLVSYNLKRYRITIDQSTREVTVQAVWVLFLEKEKNRFALSALQYSVSENDSGRGAVVTCPDGRKFELYDEEAITMFVDQMQSL